MKKLIPLIGFFALLLLSAGCKQQKSVVHYELVNGDPEIDYLDFLNDSMCRFVAPGPLTMTSRYFKQGDTYVIQISPLVNARLYKVDDKTLRGQLPFFEGIWVIKEK